MPPYFWKFQKEDNSGLIIVFVILKKFMILSQINVLIDTPPTSKGVVLEDERGGCQYGTTLLHIGCCLSLAAYFLFFSETTSNGGELCSGSITGFDDESKLLLMF